jgi:hypothetical protein
MVVMVVRGGHVGWFNYKKKQQLGRRLALLLFVLLQFALPERHVASLSPYAEELRPQSGLVVVVVGHIQHLEPGRIRVVLRPRGPRVGREPPARETRRLHPKQHLVVLARRARRPVRLSQSGVRLQVKSLKKQEK